MRSPWLQLMLLFIYFVLVLLATRLLDLILWYQHGLAPTQTVNPLMLKVRQIKLLLDSRGVSYTEYFEKNELVQLLQDSADVMIGEVEQVSEITVPLKERLKPSPTISHFNGGAHFYEQVEDTRDSVWLVQVVTSNEPILDEYNWRLVCSQLEPFGVRIGIFDCRQDFKLCETKGWMKPLLLLAMPKGRKPKDKVVLQSFTSTKPQVIVDWVHQQLSLWVKSIPNIEEVEKEWLHMKQNETIASDSDESIINKSDNSKSTSVQVLLLSHLLHPPLFLAALSIKFTGRVRFGMFTVKKEEAETVRKRLRLGDRKLPTYLVVTPEKKVVYGTRKLEYFNMWSMNVFLRAIQPEMNDVFLLSLLVVNMLVVLTVCLISTQIWWRWTAYCLWYLVKYNLWLFTAWLVFLAMGRFSAFAFVIDRLLWILRTAGLSDWGSFIRTELALLSLHPLPFPLSFISYSVCVSCLIRLLARQWLISSTYGLEVEQRPWWEVLPMDSYWVNYLFRPMASLSRPMPASQIELEDGIEMLIERLAVPNFWLQPVIAGDYIKDLPVWRYRAFNVIDEQPTTSACASANIASDAISPRLLEQMMDADDSENFVLCCCVCSREQSQPNSTSSTKTPKTPKTDTSPSQQPSRCLCALVPGWSGTPKHNCKGPFSTPDQCEKCQDNCENLRGGRTREAMCIACAHRSMSNEWNDIKSYSSLETDYEEGDVSDSDNVGWNIPECMLQTTDCAVCLEGYKYGTVLCGLPCGHNYHQRCILAWLQRDNHHCPVCRWPAYRTKSLRMHLHQE